ncbi:leucine-rich repeat-containing protein 20 [Onychomys torridus]|uniref:leucine-rich repeat-containing protein 20 n=1 Tax=Onychomys torridus TaxID=38674 RepID=UPI00167F9EA5|nr:leucine-rich repeat-containing protein 20 [Onychomys torridus]
MLRKMGEAVARVARKVNETVESSSDTLDLADCKLVSFPICIYKVLRNVSDQIHLITLANNELKSLTSKFMTTFSQLRELHLEGNCLHRLPNEVSGLQHLKAIDLSRNQFQDFPEQLTTLPELETINLEENEIVARSPGCAVPVTQAALSSLSVSYSRRLCLSLAPLFLYLCFFLPLIQPPAQLPPGHCTPATPWALHAGYPLGTACRVCSSLAGKHNHSTEQGFGGLKMPLKSPRPSRADYFSCRL